MRYSTSFISTQKAVKELDSINATLLLRGSFVHQTMAGVYTFLPLGLRVLTKIEAIVREQMNAVGAELLLPALSPQKLWETTKRLEKVDVIFEARGGNDASRLKNDATYILNPTHEDVLTPIVQQFRPSYRDLPCAVYQIQTKFRNEPRPKSGLLRGREFRMKDLYSFHISQTDFQTFYDRMKDVYLETFARLGLGDDTYLTLASGGAFTDDFSHEFQTLCSRGEDTIYLDEKTGTYYNKEVAPAELIEKGAGLEAAEVGNIFPLGTAFAEAFDYRVTNEQGEQVPVHMGSYGIGTSRVMGVLVEKFHDDRGIIWPAQVAPFTVHLVGLNSDDPAVAARATTVYAKLTAAGVDVLFDDRQQASPGEMLADADLVGCPWRAVVSRKTGEEIELKARRSPATELVSLDGLIKKVSLV